MQLDKNHLSLPPNRGGGRGRLPPHQPPRLELCHDSNASYAAYAGLWTKHDRDNCQAYHTITPAFDLWNSLLARGFSLDIEFALLMVLYVGDTPTPPFPPPPLVGMCASGVLRQGYATPLLTVAPLTEPPPFGKRVF